ncbi:unnamed protein product [Cyprideis torosa]|uniref:Uncharacterized protein n=1 Tax=Cyprideis torosa TaxID=163714 RepID=A0A7R8ZI22_9CRUS|nr:unnamed protein product [Cyprideis torosa]CAG0879113.1 unnamed protein product [Cyprideis torosa]
MSSSSDRKNTSNRTPALGIPGEFFYDPKTFHVTPEHRASWSWNGYVILRNLFDAEEVSILRETMEADEAISKNAMSRQDGSQGQIRLSMWSHPANDAFGMAARCYKVAGTIEKLMDVDEIYHYHTKLILKDQETGGAFQWHQDYGYWYKNSTIFPGDMGTVFIPVDPCRKENGCLKVIPGSHRMGRVDHVRIGEQVMADPQRIAWAEEKLGPAIDVEMNPGDALFFHSCLLHSSGQNRSHLRRWVLITTYNSRRNDPIVPHHHASYTPLVKVANDKVKDIGVVRESLDRDYNKSANDKSIHDDEEEK